MSERRIHTLVVGAIRKWRPRLLLAPLDGRHEPVRIEAVERSSILDQGLQSEILRRFAARYRDS